jgi:hypothetical protein
MRENRFLTSVESVLKRRGQLFANVHDNRDLTQYFINLQAAIFLFTFIYGASMGLYAGGIQILYSALKIPLLLFITLYISLPTFYILDSLLGGAMSIRQMLTILLAGFTIMATILLAFLPVTLFFLLTTMDYVFTVLLNISVFGLGGIGALIYFLTGYFAFYRLETQPGPQLTKVASCPSCTKPVKPEQAFCPFCGTRIMRGGDKGFRASSLPILIGCAVLVFVGTQLAWILRPYFNFSPFFIRPLGGNFYTALLHLLFPWWF